MRNFFIYIFIFLNLLSSQEEICVGTIENSLINCLQNNIDTPLTAKKYLRNLEIVENIYQSNILKSRVECK